MIVENITKIYQTSSEKIVGIENFSYYFEKGKFYAIIGHSGSGKSTLIKILGLMEKYDSGTYTINNKDVHILNDKELSSLRMNNIGFVFQDYKLDENLKAYENVILPMLINDKIDKNKRKDYSYKLLEKVGLKNRVNHFPKELSGGEQQRVCIARALANSPDYILCDEPTGNLDEANEINILNILKQLTNLGKCVIVVSHSNEILKFADEVLTLKDGRLTKEDANENI